MIVHSVAVGNEQLASIANGKRMLGNSFVGERVVEIFYFYMSGVFHRCKFSAKLHKMHGKLTNFAS